MINKLSNPIKLSDTSYTIRITQKQRKQSYPSNFMNICIYTKSCTGILRRFPDSSNNEYIINAQYCDDIMGVLVSPISNIYSIELEVFNMDSPTKTYRFLADKKQDSPVFDAPIITYKTPRNMKPVYDAEFIMLKRYITSNVIITALSVDILVIATTGNIDNALALGCGSSLGIAYILMLIWYIDNMNISLDPNKKIKKYANAARMIAFTTLACGICTTFNKQLSYDYHLYLYAVSGYFITHISLAMSFMYFIHDNSEMN